MQARGDEEENFVKVFEKQEIPKSNGKELSTRGCFFINIILAISLYCSLLPHLLLLLLLLLHIMKGKDVALLLVCAVVVVMSFYDGGWHGSSNGQPGFSFSFIPAFRIPLPIESFSNRLFPLKHELLYV
jgi:hypothetical protein